MKIIVLGNQAKAMSNFWSVLIRHMRSAGHEVVCCAPPGDTDAEAALVAQGARVRHYSLDRKGLNPLSDMRTTQELFKLFRDEKPDLLFASTIKPVIYGCMPQGPLAYPIFTLPSRAWAMPLRQTPSLKNALTGWAACCTARRSPGRKAYFFRIRTTLRFFASRAFLGPGHACSRRAALAWIPNALPPAPFPITPTRKV